MKKFKTYGVYIGIDPGVNTGFAVWDAREGEFTEIVTTDFLYGIEKVMAIHSVAPSLMVRVEDARLRTWYGKKGAEVLQGVGSVKRETALWELFLQRAGIEHEMVHPKSNKTKLDDAMFKRITGWDKRTSVHARDAAMLVLNK